MDDQRDYAEEAANASQVAEEAADELQAERIAYLNSLPSHLRELPGSELDDPVLTLSQAIQFICDHFDADPVETFKAWMDQDNDKLRRMLDDKGQGLFNDMYWCAIESGSQDQDVLEILIRDELVGLGVREAD